MRYGPADRDLIVGAHDLIDAQGWGPGPYGGETWCASDGGVAVGVLRLVDAGPDTYIEDVIVREDLRGNGIGSDLMRAAMASRDGGLYLVCHPERVAFYRRLGFSEVQVDDLPPEVTAVCDAEGDLNSDHAHLHHFMAHPWPRTPSAS